MEKLRDRKGIVGLDTLIAVIIALFLVGFLLMIFALMGSELEESVWDSISGTVANESLVAINETGKTLTREAQYNEVECTVSACINQSGDLLINSANYTTDSKACTIAFTGADLNYNNSNWSCTYTYSGLGNNTASGVIFETSSELSGTTDWYDIIIVLTVMVVLVLLASLIIDVIRGWSTDRGTVDVGAEGKVPTETA